MKKSMALLLALVFSYALHAQITIGSSDLPSAGDTFRLSIANTLAGANYTLTGSNYTWDFSQLTPASQRVDTFLDVNATNPIYSVVFSNFSFNPNRSNVATAGTDFSLGTIAVTGVYNFYYNSSASYSQTGFGASVNGVPLPNTYSPKDLVYKFPLQMGDVDTSLSGYQVDLTSTVGLFFKVNRSRVNQVDGWGTLITPYGTHDVLRVKTTVVERDSVYIDSLQFGLNLPPVTTIEYKWMANGEGVPLLQANASANGTVNQVLYRDNAPFNTGFTSIKSTDCVVYPNPAQEVIFIDGLDARNCQFALFDMNGRVVLEGEWEMTSSSSHALYLDRSRLAAGNYLLRLAQSDATILRNVTLR